MRLLIYVALMSLATHALANNIIEGNQGSKIKGRVVNGFKTPGPCPLFRLTDY